MFKFLKIRTSEFGDARRHVTFASIIHKHVFPLFVCLVFLFCHLSSLVSAFALADPQPQFQPIYDTDIVNFQNSYNSLNPGAQAAANILFGAYLTEYAGLADYGTVFDDVPSDVTVWDRLEFAGQQFVDTLFLPVNMADQLVLSPLIDLGQGIVNKVKGYNSVTGFQNDVFNASSYGLSYTPDIGFSLNQVLARDGGLYNWQFDTVPWLISPSVFTWNTTDLGSAASSYYQYLDGLAIPRIQMNDSSNYNLWFSYSPLADYKSFYFNTSNGNLYLFNPDSKQIFDASYTLPVVGISTYNGTRAFSSSIPIRFQHINVDLSLYSTLVAAIQAAINLFASTSDHTYSYNLSLYVNSVYAGTTPYDAVQVDHTTDLGFTNTDSLEVLNPVQGNDLLFDLKALIQHLVNQGTTPQVEVPLQPIVYNITHVQGTGDSLTRADLEGLAFNVTPPQSGIDVPSNAFVPFFQDGGILNYFWYMTKPMVVFARDVLDVFTFGPEGGFLQTGPGYFVLGAVALGLLGGVVVKFLL